MLTHPVWYLGRTLRLGICLGSCLMLGEAYLHVHCRPQCKRPSRRFLNPTVQSLSKALVSPGFVISKELRK